MILKNDEWKKRILEHLHGIFAKSIIKLQGVEEAKNTLGSPCSSNCTIIARCILVIIIYSYYYTQSSLTLVRVKAHMKFSTEEFEIWRHICSYRNLHICLPHVRYFLCFIYLLIAQIQIFMYWTCNSMNNLSSYCGLVNLRISASDKDLPV